MALFEGEIAIEKNNCQKNNHGFCLQTIENYIIKADVADYRVVRICHNNTPVNSRKNTSFSNKQRLYRRNFNGNQCEFHYAAIPSIVSRLSVFIKSVQNNILYNLKENYPYFIFLCKLNI